jgi:hypothetical protein
MANDEGMCTTFAFKQFLDLKGMLQAKGSWSYKCRSYIPIGSAGTTF